MSQSVTLDRSDFNIVEANIEDHCLALDSGKVTSLALVISYLHRIATYDICGGLNSFTVFNDNVIQEAAASDARRARGLKPRPLEGIPYTIKDSYSVAGLTVTNGSPALAGLMSKRDSAVAGKLREAGAILIGKTNMPPMAAGGMQRGLYGRAESPYNTKYLTAAFSSGSSNGAASSIASSMAVIGLGSETVSSGRSPASNNFLVCYTPSKGRLSTRGLFPLYVSCDVPVPYTRSVSDMLRVLDVLATPDPETTGDFFREQKCITIPGPPLVDYQALKTPGALKGKTIGVPRMYVGQQDSNPHAKPTYVSPEVVSLWLEAEKDLIQLGACIVYTDFPLVTNYEDDTVSGEANNVQGCPSNWNALERSDIIAISWNTFLKDNDDPNIKGLADIKETAMLFPRPKEYLPDTFLEKRNWINYAGLPALLESIKHHSIHEQPGLEQALRALEAQRQRDLEAWMDTNNIDVIAFPAQGDVGIADLEFNLESTTHSLRNGVKYSNGNRAIRHLGVPTVSVPMGMMAEKKMPVNLTFAGKAYHDTDLLRYAFSYEQGSQKRVSPPLTPALPSDFVAARDQPADDDDLQIEASVQVEAGGSEDYRMAISGTLSKAVEDGQIEVWVDGKMTAAVQAQNMRFNTEVDYKPIRPVCLGWDLKPLAERRAMVIVVAKAAGAVRAAALKWVDYNGNCR